MEDENEDALEAVAQAKQVNEDLRGCTDRQCTEYPCDAENSKEGKSGLGSLLELSELLVSIGFAFARDNLATWGAENPAHNQHEHYRVNSKDSKQGTDEGPTCAVLCREPTVVFCFEILPTKSSCDGNDDGRNLDSIQAIELLQTTRQANQQFTNRIRENAPPLHLHLSNSENHDKGQIQQVGVDKHPLKGRMKNYSSVQCVNIQSQRIE